MTTTQTLYVVLIALVAFERLVELVITKRNISRMLARGGIELGRGHYPVMVVLHTAFLVLAPLEVFWLDRAFLPWLGWPMLALLAATMIVRYWAIVSLGDRWATRVVVVPGEAAVRRGPYRFLKHPNYLVVVIEILALPLVHTAWLTAVTFTLGNALLLRTRIRVEEEALREHGDYQRVFAAEQVS